MSTIRFADGISFDTSGPLRVTLRKDGMYVVGQGMLIPIKDRKEAHALIQNLSKNRESPVDRNQTN